MISCDDDSVSKIRVYTTDICKFLHCYRWLQDAYVSDFFFREHWKNLPEAWNCSLSQMSTNELRWLVDRSQRQVSQVLPLSLISFRACTQIYSADRYPVNDIESNWRETVQKNDNTNCANCTSRADGWSKNFDLHQRQCGRVMGRSQNDLSRSGSEASHIKLGNTSSKDITHHCTLSPDPGSQRGSSKSNSEVTKKDIGPVNEEGVLHYFYRKHVKPKKQHEIVNLAKVVQLLSNQIGCYHVVDVGGGLGHLSRLLSFGYSLKVTSVEASDGHAPKAHKYDREVDKEIKKKKDQIDSGPVTMPHHVTSMIYPNMTADDFLTIIHAHADTEDISRTDDIECVEIGSSGASQTFKHGLKDYRYLNCDVLSKVPKLSSTCKHRTEKMDAGSDRTLTSPSDKIEVSGVSEPNDTLKEQSIAVDFKNLESDNFDTDIFETDINVRDFNQGDDHKQSNCRLKETHTLVENIQCSKSEHQNKDCTQSQKPECTVSTSSKLSGDFILTGLHACGDLTPTFLRFFINCSTAKGLASVGCCYMKLTDRNSEFSESQENSSIGYPMSDFVWSLPNHRLSYNSRELACHFADTYSKRLKDNPPHLKIHSYRAALEWIANQLCPDFKRSAIQIPAKKTNKMDFESYARLGLVKLGISPDLLTEDLLNTGMTMIERWKDVVSFYTLRLSLAPVVETLLLLDRMIFLYEQGVSSILMPIFDPNVSPRNFVLVAWK